MGHDSKILDNSKFEGALPGEPGATALASKKGAGKNIAHAKMRRKKDFFDNISDLSVFDPILAHYSNRSVK